MENKENQSMVYGNEKVYEMVIQQYKNYRNNGSFQSISDIYSKMPPSRIDKSQYAFLFDNIRQSMEEKLIYRTNLEKILEKENKATCSIEIKNLKEIKYEKEEGAIYKEKLTSGAPIFKSIQYMRFQDNEYFDELIGDQFPFLEDRLYLNLTKSTNDITNIRHFIEDEDPIEAIKLSFLNENTVQIQSERFPTIEELDKRADVMAKQLLLQIYSEQHKKLKQSLKSDEVFVDMLKEEKKQKTEMEVQKLKEGEFLEEAAIQAQVNKILDSLEEKANISAHEEFKKRNGERAVQTKKSLEKLKSSVRSEPSVKMKLKMLISYKHKKAW